MNCGKSGEKFEEIWLVGNTSTEISCRLLPSIRHILSRYFYLHVHDKLSTQESARITSKEVLSIWIAKKIPCREERNIIVNIKKLHDLWIKLQKDKYKTSLSVLRKRNAFSGQLDNLFDIVSTANDDQKKLTDSVECLLNLLRQNKRVPQKLVEEFENDDKEVEKNDQNYFEKSIKRRKLEIQVPCQPCDENINTESDVEFESNNSADSDNDYVANNVLNSDIDYVFNDSDDSDDFVLQQEEQKINIMTDDVCGALDRAKVSNRNAVYIVVAICKALNQNIGNIACSASTIRRCRQNFRKKTAEEIKKTFNTSASLVVHWDGKMMQALTSKEKVDRLAILVSGNGLTKLLNVPVITSGTGESQAQAVYESLLDWNVSNRVNAMCFDTTASNSGQDAGACTLLEKKLGKTLLALACRHHIMELPVSSVFNVLFGPSSGPKIKLFERFQQKWPQIDETKFESGIEDHNLCHLITPFKADLIVFIKCQLNNFQPRDDYKELLQLTLLFLGENSTKSVHINSPGAVHRARWMAKIIYCLKIYLFRKQFSLSASELSALRNFNLFAVKIYLKNWFECPKATLAPANDLQMMKDLLKYKATNLKIANAAFKTMSRHMWYLSEKLIGLAFFESTVSVEQKRAMVLSLDKIAPPNPPRKITVDENKIANQELHHFVTKNTREFFKEMQICEDFLNKDPSFWTEDDNYLKDQKRLWDLKVVNDAAERGVALIQNYNAILTNQEKEKQYLLQVIEKHRQEMPNSNKTTVMQSFSN